MRRPSSFAVLALVLLVLFSSTPTLATIPTPTIHGKKYPQLDCSACLAVAYVLAHRMNETKSYVAIPDEYLQQNKKKKINAHSAEARAFDVTDRICEHPLFRTLTLRLNPKTKIRTYHIPDYKTLWEANKSEFLEFSTFPEDEVLPDEPGDTLLPEAPVYSAKEAKNLAPLAEKGPSKFCPHLMEDAEDEIIYLVTNARTLQEVEHHLCGLGYLSVDKDAREEDIIAMEAAIEQQKIDEATWIDRGFPASDVCRQSLRLRRMSWLDRSRYRQSEVPDDYQPKSVPDADADEEL